MFRTPNEQTKSLKISLIILSKRDDKIALWVFSSSFASCLVIQNLRQTLLAQQSTHLDASKDETIITIKLLYFEFCSNHPKKKKRHQALMLIFCDKLIFGSQRSKNNIIKNKSIT
jgi:hypothetical protein